MRRVIGILSGKGGVGKTVITVNLGLALNYFGEDNVIVDADLQNPNLGLHLGFYEYNLTLHDALEQGLSILDVIHLHHTGLKIVPSSLSLEYIYTSPDKMKELFQELRGHVLVDSAPGLGREVMSILKACDEVLIVTNPEIPAISDCIRIVEVARRMNKNIIGIIINRKRNKNYEITNEEIEEVCKAKILGVVPEDENVRKSISVGTPVVVYKPHSKSSIAIKKIAAQLIEKEYEPPKFLFLRRLF
jgi:septum site-determining protein MinD